VKLRRLFGAAALAGLMCLSVARDGWAAEDLPKELEGVTVEEHLGATLDPSLEFIDHTGQKIRLDQLLRDDKPVILTLNYYTCGTLCSVVLNAVLNGLKDLAWTAGQEFRVVTISIDPNETSSLAAAKRASYLDALGRGEVDWSFLVGDEIAIEKVARTVGFQYRYDEATQQFAHPAMIAVIGPGGTVARYLYGVEFPARDLKFALIEAAEGRVGSPVDKLILSCFHYDAASGKYTPAAFGVMRIGGALSAMGLGIFTWSLWRRERQNRSQGSVV
jgi:protein SCO1/2